MSSPQTHAPAPDSDAISFGELSSPSESADECASSHAPKAAHTQWHDSEPRLDSNNGFTFENTAATPSLDRDGFEFADAETSFFSDANAAGLRAAQASVHTVHTVDEQPGAGFAGVEQAASSAPRESRPMGMEAALGVLYCGTCDRAFGNEKVFKRHFMFGARHGGESRDMRDLYYRVWRQTWADEARDVQRRGWGRAVDVDAMEL